MIRLEQNGVILFIEGYTENNDNYVYRGESISVYIDASGAAVGSFAGFVALNVNGTNLKLTITYNEHDYEILK